LECADLMAKTKSYLPIEFPDFGELEKGYSLVIKGLPGTGKSSLALELIVKHPNSFFVTTRIDPETIIQDFPWVKERISKEREEPFFVDATQTSSVISKKDDRLSTTLNYETMPDFVQSLFSLGSSYPNKIIVIDSWNALTVNLSDSQVSHWGSVIVQHLRSEGSKIIFVIEGVENTSLDWTIDGICVLNKRTITSSHGIPRRIRELSFLKMRGKQIHNETYLATLKSGRFKTFNPFKYRFPAIILKSPSIPDPGENFISTGVSEFDDLLGGGFVKGSWNLFEVATTVGNALDIILFPLVTNHLNNKRPVISIFREGVTFESKRGYFDVFTGAKDWVSQTLNFERYLPKNTKNRIQLPDDIDDLLEQLENSKQKLRKTVGSPFLISLGLDVLENKYGIRKLNKFIAILVSKAKLEGDIIVGWLMENQKFQGGTAAATSHWRIELINRALVLKGIIPATEYFAIESVLFKGYVDYKLTAVL